MKQKGMKKFVLLTLLALLPVFAYVALYVVMDPFRIIHRYHGVAVLPCDSLERIPNKRYVAIEGFKIYNPKEHFDSFIFGSSISSNFLASEWKKFLPDSASVYHFTEGAQTLTGIRDELKYLIDHDVKVRHAMFVMEEEMFRRPKRYEEMPFMPHPDVSPEMNWLHFHRVHFNAFRDPDILLYNLYPTEAVTRRLLSDGKMTTVPCERNEMINEDYSTALDTLILRHAQDYYSQVPWLVEMQPRPEPMPLSIDNKAADVLREIARLLNENDIDYIVIVPPRFRIQGLSAFDQALLNEIFGADHVNDFSWDMELINDLHSYYDGTHILTHRCSELIARCYQKQSLQYNP